MEVFLIKTNPSDVMLDTHVFQYNNLIITTDIEIIQWCVYVKYVCKYTSLQRY